ncbi:alpha/beta-hydrolase [Aspergillus campestris IBT 28561]|uniref:Alpha/beta-hydrolase n=1 Tax=Aspergillus campestris (strain IBT 28561) TaxID=1392248 RepID=A0A2I1D6N3_ASPC2|nr:alpha/beta-hydrolase [Aspergillus campestris IBT 28561]PKY05544.1 alpha/beta-hydrolase [Aspergillus campestris IBT 28561]
MGFPEPHIHSPQSTHTHTVILLHGRGSNGPEFAEELFSSKSSKNQNLASSLPNWRWVFPTSRDRWNTRFEEEICAWFDAYSLTDVQERQELQIEGLRESVLHIVDILENEIRLLGGKASHVYLGGMSQGMATALCTLFCVTGAGRIQGQLGGFLGFCGWLPFVRRVEDLVRQAQETNTLRLSGGAQTKRLVSEYFLHTIFGSHDMSSVKEVSDTSILSTPVFLSHGTDDAWVPVEQGRQAAQILQQSTIQVEWNEFSGAEGDGHWIKEPEGFDQILQFVEKQRDRNQTESQ